MAKETRLDESAQIYQPREKQSDRAKFKEMNRKQKFTYFKDYYLMKCFFVLLALVFVGSLAYSIFGPKVDTVLHAAVINGVFSDTTAQSMETDMEARLELDTKKSDVHIDTSFFIGDDYHYGPSTEQKLVALLMAGDIDIIIAPEKEFAIYVAQGYMAKLSDQLPTQLFSSLSDRFLSSVTKDDPKEAAYGIYLNNYQLYDTNGTVVMDPVIGICLSSKHKDNGIALIQYLEEVRINSPSTTPPLKTTEETKPVTNHTTSNDKTSTKTNSSNN